jgi:hypothetical protein
MKEKHACIFISFVVYTCDDRGGDGGGALPGQEEGNRERE